MGRVLVYFLISILLVIVIYKGGSFKVYKRGVFGGGRKVVVLVGLEFVSFSVFFVLLEIVRYVCCWVVWVILCVEFLFEFRCRFGDFIFTLDFF